MIEKEKNYHFNIMDCIIIIAICLAIASLCFCISGGDISQLTEKQIEISYVLSIDSSSAPQLKVGDKIYTGNGEDAGRITAMSQTANTISLTINADAYEVDEILFIKGQKLAQGEAFSMKLSDENAFSTMCMSVIIFD